MKKIIVLLAILSWPSLATAQYVPENVLFPPEPWEQIDRTNQCAIRTQTPRIGVGGITTYYGVMMGFDDRLDRKSHSVMALSWDPAQLGPGIDTPPIGSAIELKILIQKADGSYVLLGAAPFIAFATDSHEYVLLSSDIPVDWLQNMAMGSHLLLARTSSQGKIEILKRADLSNIEAPMMTAIKCAERHLSNRK